MQPISQKPVVLVIDSDALNMTAVAAALHLSGYESHCARDVEAARKAGRDLTLDLIICEVNLEGHSGLELCQEIQRWDHNRDVPLMFLSAYQNPDVIRRADESEGVYYLRKPFDPQILLDLVEHALWMPHLLKNQLQQPAMTGPHAMARALRQTPADA